MTNTTRTTERVLACIAALTIAGGLSAQPAEQPDPPEQPAPESATDAPADAAIDALVRDLDADSFDRRRRAHTQLTSREMLSTIEESALIDHLSREDLSAEQRVRLRRVYVEWFVGVLEHAGMGVSFRSGGSDHPGILIVQTTEGFPCHDRELLFPYDVVVAVDGVGVEEMESRSSRRWSAQEEFMRAAIISRRSGERIQLTVQRPPESLVRELRRADGMRQPGANIRATAGDVVSAITDHKETQLLSIDLPLGSYAQLGANAASLSRPLIERASAMRLARLGAPASKPAILSTDELDEGTWRRHAREPNRRAHTDLMSIDEPPQLAAVLSPGRPVAQKLAQRQINLQGKRANARFAVDDGKIADIAEIEDLPEELSPKLVGAAKRLAQQRALIEKLDERIEEQRAIAVDKSRPERERFLASGRLEQYLTQRNRAVRLQRGLVQAIRMLAEREKQERE